MDDKFNVNHGLQVVRSWTLASYINSTGNEFLHHILQDQGFIQDFTLGRGGAGGRGGGGEGHFLG